MKKILIVKLCLWFLLPAVASAGTITGTLRVGDNLSYSKISFDKAGTNTYTLEGGGSIDTSYLDGDKLAWLYCVDLFTPVRAETYPDTLVSDSGEIYGNPYDSAGQVAWLLDNYATGGQNDTSKALQAAIWTTVHGSEYDLNPSSSAFNEYTDMLSALDASTAIGTVGNYLWISPKKDDIPFGQGLVGVKVAAPVPEPATMMLFGTGIAGLAALGRRRRK